MPIDKRTNGSKLGAELNRKQGKRQLDMLPIGAVVLPTKSTNGGINSKSSIPPSNEQRLGAQVTHACAVDDHRSSSIAHTSTAQRIFITDQKIGHTCYRNGRSKRGSFMQSRIPCTLEFQQIPPPDGLPWIVYSRAKKKDADLVSARTTPDGKRNQP